MNSEYELGSEFHGVRDSWQYKIICLVAASVGDATTSNRTYSDVIIENALDLSTILNLARIFNFDDRSGYAVVNEIFSGLLPQMSANAPVAERTDIR